MTATVEQFFAAPSQGIALWGSSSMANGQPEEGSPLPVRFADRLSVLFPSVHQHAVGGTLSGHCMMQRGLRPGAVTVTSQSTAGGAGTVTVTVDGLHPCLGFSCPGDLNGVTGTLSSTWEEWSFTPADPAAQVSSGTFTSSLPQQVSGLRHVVWTGKNNIRAVEGVLADVDAIFQLAPKDTLILGHWYTPNDPHGSETGKAVAAVNAEQARRYGDQFLAVGDMLRDPDVLSRPSVRPLRIMEQGNTEDDLAAGVTPRSLVARDFVHLNGWGNLLVTDLLVERIRKLGWVH